MIWWLGSLVRLIYGVGPFLYRRVLDMGAGCYAFREKLSAPFYPHYIRPQNFQLGLIYLGNLCSIMFFPRLVVDLSYYSNSKMVVISEGCWDFWWWQWNGKNLLILLRTPNSLFYQFPLGRFSYSFFLWFVPWNGTFWCHWCLVWLKQLCIQAER